MASKIAASDINELLDCPICFERFSQTNLPKLLPCSHNVCAPCLQGLLVGRRLRCPICRKQIRVDHGDIDTLTTNLPTLQLAGIQPLGRCQVCEQDSKTSKCLHCEKKICSECLRKHTEEAKTKAREIGLLEMLNTSLQDAIEFKQNVDTGMALVESSAVAQTEQIHTQFDMLMKQLENRRDYLVQEVITHVENIKYDYEHVDKLLEEKVDPLHSVLMEVRDQMVDVKDKPTKLTIDDTYTTGMRIITDLKQTLTKCEISFPKVLLQAEIDYTVREINRWGNITAEKAVRVPYSLSKTALVEEKTTFEPWEQNEPHAATFEPREQDEPHAATFEPREPDEPHVTTFEPREQDEPHAATLKPMEPDASHAATFKPMEPDPPHSATFEPWDQDEPHATTFEPWESYEPHASTFEPREQDEPPAATFKPMEPDVPHSATFKPMEPDAPHSATFKPMEPDAPHSATFKPWESYEPHAATFGPVEQDKPHVATFEPREPDAPHAATFKPMEPNAPHASTFKPREPDAPHAATFEPREQDAPHASTFKPMEPDAPHASIFKPREPDAPHSATFKPRKQDAPHASTFQPREPDASHASTFQPREQDEPHVATFEPREQDEPHASTFQPREPDASHAATFQPREQDEPHVATFEPREQDEPHASTFGPVKPPRASRFGPERPDEPNVATLQSREQDARHRATFGLVFDEPVFDKRRRAGFDYSQRGRLVRRLESWVVWDGLVRNFGLPRGVAVDAVSGDVFVVDEAHHQVHVFTSLRHPLRSFGGVGNALGQFYEPCGVTINRNKEIIVCESGNNRCQMLTLTGVGIRLFGEKGSGRGALNRPTDVTVDTRDNMYVTSSWDHCVKVYDCDGIYCRSFGERGFVPSTFEYPSYIQWSREKCVVCDRNGVKLWSDGGDFHRAIGARNHPAPMIAPKGVTADRHGKILVLDADDHTVKVFSSEGRYVTTFPVAECQTSYSCYLACTPEGAVVVSDEQSQSLLFY